MDVIFVARKINGLMIRRIGGTRETQEEKKFQEAKSAGTGGGGNPGRYFNFICKTSQKNRTRVEHVFFPKVFEKDNTNTYRSCCFTREQHKGVSVSQSAPTPTPTRSEIYAPLFSADCVSDQYQLFHIQLCDIMTTLTPA